MIPVDQIVHKNVYTQDDGPFLVGEDFTLRAAKEFIRAACRSGELPSRFYRKRYWFTGKDFLDWIARWSGSTTVEELASAASTGQNSLDDNGLGAAQGVLP